MASIVKLWATGWFVVVVILALAANRIGRPRAAAWLVLIGLFLIATEEPLLTMWWSFQTPQQDHEGVVGLVTASARAHILDVSVFGITLLVILGWICMTGFRRGEHWSKRVLSFALAVFTLTELSSMVFVFSRGAPLPGPGGDAGRDAFGWQPLVVGLLAWAVGLWVSRPLEVHADATARG